MSDDKSRPILDPTKSPAAIRRAEMLRRYRRNKKPETGEAVAVPLDEDSKDVMDMLGTEVLNIADGIENKLTDRFGGGIAVYMTPEIAVRIAVSMTATKKNNKWVLGIGTSGSSSRKDIDIEMDFKHVAIPIDSLPNDFATELKISIENTEK